MFRSQLSLTVPLNFSVSALISRSHPNLISSSYYRRAWKRAHGHCIYVYDTKILTSCKPKIYKFFVLTDFLASKKFEFLLVARIFLSLFDWANDCSTYFYGQESTWAVGLSSRLLSAGWLKSRPAIVDTTMPHLRYLLSRISLYTKTVLLVSSNTV
jgi:hypothetical protein